METIVAGHTPRCSGGYRGDQGRMGGVWPQHPFLGGGVTKLDKLPFQRRLSVKQRTSEDDPGHGRGYPGDLDQASGSLAQHAD